MILFGLNALEIKYFSHLMNQLVIVCIDNNLKLTLGVKNKTNWWNVKARNLFLHVRENEKEATRKKDLKAVFLTNKMWWRLKK